ncbi:MAG TPA: DUF507 family protein [Polyangiaceae bacterium]|jgi:hypothetical protein
MRLHSAKVPELALQIVRALTAEGDIECESPKDVQLDVEAVLNQYIRDEQEVTERAKDLMASRGLPQTEFARIRRMVADERQLKLGDEAVDYLLDQLIETLMYSDHVNEVYAEDVELRRKMREPLRRHAASEQDLVQEVRARLKHVQEGTAVWEVEYRRIMEDIRRRKGL